MEISLFYGEQFYCWAALFSSIYGAPSSVPDFGWKDTEMTDSWALHGLIYFLELSSLEPFTFSCYSLKP